MPEVISLAGNIRLMEYAGSLAPLTLPTGGGVNALLSPVDGQALLSPSDNQPLQGAV